MCCCNVNSRPDDLIIYGNDFTSHTEYANPLLTGRFRVEMRGFGSPLIRKIEWDYLEGGGFKILIPGWIVTPDVKIIVEFY